MRIVDAEPAPGYEQLSVAEFAVKLGDVSQKPDAKIVDTWAKLLTRRYKSVKGRPAVHDESKIPALSTGRDVREMETTGELACCCRCYRHRRGH